MRRRFYDFNVNEDQAVRDIESAMLRISHK